MRTTITDVNICIIVCFDFYSTFRETPNNKKALMISATFWEDLTHGVVYRPVQVALLYWNSESINYYHADLHGNLEPKLSICVLTCSICRGWFHSRETDLLTVRQSRTPWKHNIASIQIIKKRRTFEIYTWPTKMMMFRSSQKKNP